MKCISIDISEESHLKAAGASKSLASKSLVLLRKKMRGRALSTQCTIKIITYSTMDRFCSPPPDQVLPGKSPSSPPPLPCTYDKGDDHDPTDVSSVLKDINTGRSILNGCCSLSSKRLLEEFELEDKKNDSSNKKLKLISPSSPGGAVYEEDEEEVDLDMPWIPSPINLPVRTSTFPSLLTMPSPRSVSFDGEPLAAMPGVAVPRITLSARRPHVRFQDHCFIPIQLNYEDEEEEPPQGNEDEEEEPHQGNEDEGEELPLGQD